MAEQKKSGGTRKSSTTKATSSKGAGAANKASSAPKTTASKSAPSKTAAAKPAAPRRKHNGSSPGASSGQEMRQRMIQEAAYYRALSRGFGGDAAMDDWLVAEREIDSMLGRLSG